MWFQTWLDGKPVLGRGAKTCSINLRVADYGSLGKIGAWADFDLEGWVGVELHAEEPFQATLMVMWNTSAIVSVRSKLNYRLWLLLCLS